MFNKRTEIAKGLSALLAAKPMIRYLDPERLNNKLPSMRQLRAAIELMLCDIPDPTGFGLCNGRFVFEWRAEGYFCSAMVSGEYIEVFYHDHNEKCMWTHKYHMVVGEKFIDLLNENFGVKSHEHQTKS